MEIESKYTVPDAATFDALLQLRALGTYILQPDRELELTDHYLDTPHHDLRRAGYACRVRDGEVPGRLIATLKSLGRADAAIHQREEYEVEISGGTSPEGWPESPARELVTRLAAGRALGELFVLRQHRVCRAVRHGERYVATLALDTARLGADAHETTFQECEIELAPDGTLDDLHAMDALLRAYEMTRQPASKFERALALFDARAGAPKRTKKRLGVRGDEPLAEAGRKILRFHLERMLAREAGTRALDVEALHDMRVAVRRQRAAFRIVEPCFKRKAVQGFRGDLKQLTRYLGAVRDLDVLIQVAVAHPVVALASLLEEWRARRDVAREELAAFLDGDNYQNFVVRWRTFLSSPGVGVKGSQADDSPEPHLVRDVLPAEIWSHYADVRAYEATLAQASVETIHALRIEAKRLRYLLEFFAEPLGPGVDEAVKALVAFQDHTGEIHDTDVTIGLLHDYVKRHPPVPEDSSIPDCVRGYLKLNVAKLRTLRRGLRRPWRRLTGRRFRRALARAVAEL